MQQLEYEFSNAIGFVMDKAIDPQKHVGQAFLVSKSRLVTNASSVFGYVEAPWALNVYFPFSDVRVGIKAVTLHNDFDKVAARAQYLAQAGTPGEISPTYLNDIALLTIDPQPPDVPQDRVAELNRALSLPFSGEGVEASGNLRGTEFIQIINTALEAGREGLLTLFDARNIAVAHLLIASGQIQKVFYQQVMSSEMAFCELVYRAPGVGFAFKPGADINWGEVPDVQTPADRLTWEAMRRAGEIPKLFQQLGGPDARYQHVVQNFDPEAASEEIRWMVAPLWENLDGYLSLDKLPRRVGVDTYTILVAVRELVNRGVASQINRASPFPCTGQLGSPLISHTDFEVHPWDPLQAFFLDPISGKPTWIDGNFFGVANSLQPKNMLHTIALPRETKGALILKDYKLIGIHGGPQDLKPGQPVPPVKCYQFMWMGALLDMSTRKARAAGAEGEEEGVGALRSMDVVQDEAAKPVEKIQCGTCFAMNPEYGACKTCGAVIEPPKEEPEPDNKIMASKPVKDIKKLQKKYNISDQQMKIGGGVIAACLLMGLCCLPHGGPPPAADQPTTTDGTPAQTTVAKEVSDKKAVELAVSEAGLSSTAPPMYWYKDTSAITAPTPSFGLMSDQSNQNILFIIYDDMAPVTNLDSFVGKPPFVEVDRADAPREAIIDQGEQILGAGKLRWIRAKYTAPKHEEPVELMLAGFAGAKKGKSILVVARAFDDTGKRGYVHKTTLYILDELATEQTNAANKEKEDEVKGDDVKKVSADEGDEGGDEEGGAEKTVKLSTDEEIDQFMIDAKKTLQDALELPDNLADAAKKYEEENKKPKKWKEGGLLVGVDTDGNVKRIEYLPTTEQTKNTEALNKTLEKAVQKVAKFNNAPVTKKPEFQFQVRLQGTEILLRKQ